MMMEILCLIIKIIKKLKLKSRVVSFDVKKSIDFISLEHFERNKGMNCFC